MPDEMPKLRQENNKLRKRVADLESQLEKASNKLDKATIKYEREILKLERHNFQHEQNASALKAEIEKWKKQPQSLVDLMAQMSIEEKAGSKE